MMTLHLPEELEASVRAEVRSGHFASEDELVAAAVREYLRRRQRQAPPPQPAAARTPDPVPGSMRDFADERDEIVADAMNRRREEPCRPSRTAEEAPRPRVGSPRLARLEDAGDFAMEVSEESRDAGLR